MSVPPDDDALLAAAGSRGKFDLSATGRRLEDVEDEVGTSVIRAWRRVIAEPMAVVNRNSHLGRIPVVQAIRAAEIFVTPEVLRVIHVRVVIETVPIERVVAVAPSAAIRLFLGAGRSRRPHRGEHQNGGCG